MSYDYTEDKLVQETTARYFEDHLGWTSIYAYDQEDYGPDSLLGRTNQTEVVLVRHLRRALKRYNPNLSEAIYTSAVERITTTSISKSMLQNNEDLYRLLKDGITVPFRNEKGQQDSVRLNVFDFADPTNNEFIAVRELWIQGKIYRRRPDIIGFVNGIPLLFVECKNIHKDIKTAYSNNLTDYKDTIPEIFYYNAIVMLSNGKTGKIGSITSPYEYFNEWKRLDEKDEGRVDFETMLKGLCNRVDFMDYVENFILYDDSKGKKVKIVARNHQFLGVNQAIQSVRDIQRNAGKLGVFWHTQGSGKSYSMLLFCQKILRKISGKYTFVIMTDRVDLDDQIYKTYLGTGAIRGQNMLATTGDRLRELLKEDHRYIFSLIHKFHQEPREPYSGRDDIIVISDEAHRTQYGRLAQNMRDALPKAAFIGFTGTPLFSNDELTRRIFGDYVSKYPFNRAREDNATVPLFYENRGEKLGIVDLEINQKLADKIAEYDLDPDQEAKLERDLKREYHVVTAGKRLEKIAEDFVRHYTSLWTTGKAMIICIDKITCVKMFNLIDQYWKTYTEQYEKDLKHSMDEQDELERRKKLQWLKETEIAVIVSEEQNEVKKFRERGLEIESHRIKMKTREMDNEFKDAQSKFRVAIVCAMWLTGFDVESLSTLYLDKPLKGHTLMQAIARANRIYEGKNNGLIVDYSGMLQSLRKALALYATGEDQDGKEGHGGGPLWTEEELLGELIEAFKKVEDYLGGLGFDLGRIIRSEGFDKIQAIEDGVDAIYTNDESKKTFEILARNVFRIYKHLLFMPCVQELKPKYGAIDILYKRLQKNRESADISGVMNDLHQIVDEAISTRPPVEESEYQTKQYDISKINFELLKKEFPNSKRKNTTLQILKDRIEAKLQKMIQQNPTRIDYYQEYEKIIQEYNADKDRLTIEHVFNELLILSQSLSEEETRAVREGLNEEYLAVFDLLRKEDLTANDIRKIKSIAQELLGLLKAELLNADNWKGKETTIAAVRVQIYDYLYKNLPENSYSDEEVEQKSKIIFNHIFERYDSTNNNIYAA